jgi:Eukaryotic cytochrome b561
LQSCDESYTGSSATKSKQGAFAAHGTLAVLAWGVATPFAMTVAWFRTLVPSSWIYIHVFSNVISFVFTVVAVIVAITAQSGQTSPSHFSHPHHIVGVALLVLMTFQIMNGFMRPPVEKKDPYSARQFVEGKNFFEIPRSPRGLWMLIHRLSGVAMLGMGMYQISSGLTLFADDFDVTSIAPWFWLYAGFFAFFLIALRVWILMEEQKARHGMEVLSYPDEEGSYDMDREGNDLAPPLM